MKGYRKLGRATKERKAMLRKLTTDFFLYGKVKTTLLRAKELRKVVEPFITLAKKEHGNFDEVKIEVKVPKKDQNGRRIREIVDGKRKEVYETIDRTIKKDRPSRLNARRKMLAYFYPVTVLEKGAKKKKTTKFDLAKKMFDEIGPKYVQRNGGYTRIIKLGERRGDAAEMAIIEMV